MFTVKRLLACSVPELLSNRATQRRAGVDDRAAPRSRQRQGDNRAQRHRSERHRRSDLRQHARQAGVGPNAARQIAVKGGLRHEVPAYTVNQACGSGLRAIMKAADQIRLGHGATAETLADRYKISRREQDEYAVDTQRRAKAAYDENRFANEIVPLEKLDRDEHPRFDADLGSLAKLPAASSVMRRRASTRRSWASDRFPRRSGCCAKSGSR